MKFIETYNSFFVLLPFLIALNRFKSLNKERYYLFTAIMLDILTELCMLAAGHFWKNTLPVVHLSTVIEFSLLISVFYYGKPGLISARLYKTLIIFFLTVEVLSLLFYRGVWEENTAIRSLEGIILIAMALYFFYMLLRCLEVLNPEKTFMFWFSIAILIYFVGNLLLSMYVNSLWNSTLQSGESPGFLDQIWTLRFILNIFLYILYSIAFLCKESKTIPKSSWSVP